MVSSKDEKEFSSRIDFTVAVFSALVKVFRSTAYETQIEVNICKLNVHFMLLYGSEIQKQMQNVKVAWGWWD